MNQKPIKTLNLLIYLVVTLLVGCGFDTGSWELKKANQAEKDGKHKQAIEFYYKFLKKNQDSQESIPAAQKIYKLSSVETNDNTLIEMSLRHIILRSDDPSERMAAQFNLADHFFFKKRNYEKAINNYNKVLGLTAEKQEKWRAKLNVAKAYFYLNNFYQAKTELREILDGEPEDKYKFEVKIVLASVLQSEKQYSEAIGIYESVLTEYPAQAEKDQVFMNLALVLEDNKDFDEAVELLERYKNKHSNPTYIEEKISKIKFLISQQPGARGRVK